MLEGLKKTFCPRGVITVGWSNSYRSRREHRLGFTLRSQFASGFQFSPGVLGGACVLFTQKEWDPDS